MRFTVSILIIFTCIVILLNFWFSVDNSLNSFKSKEILKNNQAYHHVIHYRIPEEIRAIITGVSYRQDSPVSIEDLAYIKLTYWGFDRKTHMGELIVHKEVADEIVDIFHEIYLAKFPIDKMRLIDRYNASDDLSMADNNTSAFCVRSSRNSTVLSKHSYGLAVDINPIQNPYIKGKAVIPQEAEEFKNRRVSSDGMIVPGGAVYNAFKKRNWKWGGEWQSIKDYQHFEK